MNTHKVMPKIPSPILPPRRKEKSLLTLEPPPAAEGLEPRISKKLALQIKEDAPRGQKGALARCASAQLLFVLLPILVAAMTLGAQGRLQSLLNQPLWSVVSAVLVGQSIVTLLTLSPENAFVRRETTALVLSLLLVGVLAPTLILLAMALGSGALSPALAAGQGAYFLLSALVYFLASMARAAEERP